MKKTMCLLTVLFALFVFVGCSSEPNANTTNNIEQIEQKRVEEHLNRYRLIAENGANAVYVDKYTNLVYWRYRGRYKITVMPIYKDAAGTIMTLEEWEEEGRNIDIVI